MLVSSRSRPVSPNPPYTWALHGSQTSGLVDVSQMSLREPGAG